MKISATITYQFDSLFSPFRASQFNEGLEWAKNNGLDGVEICISDYNDEIPKVKATRIMQKISSLGLQVSTISTGQAFGREGISLAVKEKEFRDLAVSRIKEHIDAAAVFNSCVTIGLIRGKAGKFEHLHESMQTCVEYAMEKNVTLIIEPLNRYETDLINNSDEAVNFFKKLYNPPNLKILWDTFHANIEEVGISNEVIKHIAHIHLADSNRHFPGFGHINFNAFFEQLVKFEYGGWLSLECLNKPFHNTTIDSIKKLIETIRRIDKL